jgi:hypothetical protein
MPKGRPSTSATVKKARGTFRAKDKVQLAAEEALALEPISSISPPDWLAPELVPTWRSLTADLCKMGAVIPADLPLLAQAFRGIMNCAKLQAMLDTALEGGDVAEIHKLSSALVAQGAAWERILGKFGVGPSERVRLIQGLPRRDKDPKKKSAIDFLEGGS